MTAPAYRWPRYRYVPARRRGVLVRPPRPVRWEGERAWLRLNGVCGLVAAIFVALWLTGVLG